MTVTAPKGFRASGVTAGLKASGRPDLALVVNDGTVEKHVTNNVVLKKLRVAFELKDVDMHQIFEDAGFPVSKPELSAVFRQRDHKHFRKAGDQLMRYFLKGLVLRVRGSSSTG